MRYDVTVNGEVWDSSKRYRWCKTFFDWLVEDGGMGSLTQGTIELRQHNKATGVTRVIRSAVA